MEKRIQKFLSEQGICSRREAEELIKKGDVFVNNKKATLGDKVEGTEEIKIGEEVVTVKTLKRIVIAFHKPRGIESTLKNEHGGKTLADFDFNQRVFPIGRLDKDSRGLLLLTNDGDLGNKLAHPRYQHEKEYLVSIDKKLTSEIIKRLGSGKITINEKNVAPCKVEQIDNKIFSIILKEGKNRQIRKMCEECDLRVKDLLRISVGNINLDEIKPGKFRVLSSEEVKNL